MEKEITINLNEIKSNYPEGTVLELKVEQKLPQQNLILFNIEGIVAHLPTLRSRSFVSVRSALTTDNAKENSEITVNDYKIQICLF